MTKNKSSSYLFSTNKATQWLKTFILFLATLTITGCLKVNGITSSVLDPLRQIVSNRDYEVFSAEGVQTVTSDDGQYVVTGKIGAFTAESEDPSNGDVEIVGTVRYE